MRRRSTSSRTIWFRNTWSWGRDNRHPQLRARRRRQRHRDDARLARHALARTPSSTAIRTSCSARTRRTPDGSAASPTRTPFPKDGINDHVRRRRRDGQPRAQFGTKAAAWYRLDVPAGESVRIRLRLTNVRPERRIGRRRLRRGRRRRASARPTGSSTTSRPTCRRTPSSATCNGVRSRGCCGRRSTSATTCASGSTVIPALPPPPAGRKHGRNSEWTHLYNADIISMPDEWEYPWYAAWDLAFHMLPMAIVDRRLRQGPAADLLPRVVHAPERSASRLRVGVQRRQPAGARLGGVAVYKIDARARARRTPSSSSGSSTSC